MKLTLLAMVTFGLNTMAEAAASTVDTFAEVVAECATVTVGSADWGSPTKVIKFASTTLNCPSTVSKINWVSDDKWDIYNDEFKIAQTKDAIFVTRTDEIGFWGLDLKIKCCPNIPRSNIAPPPPPPCTSWLSAFTKDECEAEEVNGRPCEYSEFESTCTDTTLCETVANGFEFTGAKGCCINSMDVNHLSSMPKSFLIDFVKEYPEMCRKDGWRDTRSAAVACGRMGGVFCKGPPSQAPTAAPSNAPTISPLDVCKADLAGARAELASSKTCTPSDRGSLAESCDVMNCRDWTCNGPGVENWCTCFTEEAEKLKIFELLGCGQDGSTSTCRCET